MQHHSELDDNTFEVLFREGNFPAALFSHEAHLRLAWIHLRRYGLEQAIENVSRQLQRNAHGGGSPGGVPLYAAASGSRV